VRRAPSRAGIILSSESARPRAARQPVVLIALEPRTWTAPPEGTWAELATFSKFRQMPQLHDDDWFEVEEGDAPVELARGGRVECADAAAAWQPERLSGADRGRRRLSGLRRT